MRDISGIPLLLTFTEFSSRPENTNVGVLVSEHHEAKKKLLEDQFMQLEFENSASGRNYDEEVTQSEALTNKLKDDLERLDNLQNKVNISKHVMNIEA